MADPRDVLMRTTKLITALVSAAALLVSGCDTTPSEDDVNVMFNELMQRPDIESMQSEYLALLEKIRGRLVSDVGIEPFIPDDEGIGGSGCPGDMSQVREAEVRYMRSGRSPGNISDADWPRAKELVAGLAREQGLDTVKVVVDRKGDHEVAIYDDYGAELIFGTAKNTILSLTTGCHLNREAHQRGTPEADE